MIDQIIKMLEITESKHENVLILRGKYELKDTVKEMWRDAKKYKP